MLSQHFSILVPPEYSTLVLRSLLVEDLFQAHTIEDTQSVRIDLYPGTNFRVLCRLRGLGFGGSLERGMLLLLGRLSQHQR